MVAKSSPNTRWLLAMTGQPRPHRNDGNVPFVDGEPRTKRNGIDLQARPAETLDYGARIHVRPWRLSRGRDHRQRLRPDEIAEHLVIPSEAEESLTIPVGRILAPSVVTPRFDK